MIWMRRRNSRGRFLVSKVPSQQCDAQHKPSSSQTCFSGVPISPQGFRIANAFSQDGTKNKSEAITEVLSRSADARYQKLKEKRQHARACITELELEPTIGRQMHLEPREWADISETYPHFTEHMRFLLAKGERFQYPSNLRGVCLLFCFLEQSRSALERNVLGLPRWQTLMNRKWQMFCDMQVHSDLFDGAIQHIAQLFTIHRVNGRL